MELRPWWLRGETRAKVTKSGDRTVQVLGGYVRGTAFIAAVDAVFIGIALAIQGVPLALPLGVIVFIGGDPLQPIVMGRTLNLHGLVVPLALAAGTMVGGIFGAILAVTLTGWCGQ